MSRAWVITLHRFEHDEGGGGVVDFGGIPVPVEPLSGRRHNEVARLDGDMPPAAVAVLMERWYAEHYQPQWTEGKEVDEKAVPYANGDIDVGHEPKLTARLVEDTPQPPF